MSIKNDFEMFQQLFTSADVPWRFGCFGDEEIDFDDEDAIDESGSEDTYITVLGDGGDRIGFSFDETGKFVGLKSYK